MGAGPKAPHSRHGTNASVAVGSASSSSPPCFPFPSPHERVIAQWRLSIPSHQHDHPLVSVPLASYLEFSLSVSPLAKTSPPINGAREIVMDARPPHPFSHRPPLHAQSNNHPPPSPPQHSLAPPPHFGGYAPATSQPQPQPQPPIHMPFSADPYPSARRDPFFPHAAAQHAHHVSAPEHAPAGDRQFGWGGTGTLDSSLKTLGALPHEPLRCIGSCRLSKTVVGLITWAPGGQAAAGV